LDFKMLMSVSKKLRTLDLKTEDEGITWKNLEQTDLRGLKMLSFDCPMFDMVQMTHIMTELEARPEFIVQYGWVLYVEMAEKLDKWLTLPNFKWNNMEATSDEEYNRAVEICTNNCIDLNRISYCPI